MKIENDKYYTNKELAKYLVKKFNEIIGEDNISEYLEPSAGDGVFLEYFGDKPFLAYDIEPEGEKNIVRQDFLSLDLPYKKGRAIIGNPPFGNRNLLSLKFFKKSILLGDYIGFILPISQLDNDQTLYEFDLIYSEDLGEQNFSDRNLRCCFNVFKKPKNGYNNKNKYNLGDVLITEYRRGNGSNVLPNWDYAICTWGNGSCGKTPSWVGQYAQEHYFYIKNKELKEKILNVCNSTDWRNLNNSIGSSKIQTWRIYKHLKNSVPEIK